MNRTLTYEDIKELSKVKTRLKVWVLIYGKRVNNETIASLTFSCFEKMIKNDISSIDELVNSLKRVEYISFNENLVKKLLYSYSINERKPLIIPKPNEEERVYNILCDYPIHNVEDEIILDNSYIPKEKNGYYYYPTYNPETKKNNCTILGCSLNSKELSIPSKLNNLTVTSINIRAFHLPYLEKIIFPDSIEHFGPGMFIDCPRLKEIIIPANMKSIVLTECLSIEEVELPGEVENIYGLYGCKKLRKIFIPKTCNKILEYSFSGCDNLTIFAEAEMQPDGWDKTWNSDNRPVIWKAKKEEYYKF